MKWYKFTETEGADICLPENYLSSTEEKPQCEGSNKVCAIYAEDNGNGKPLIDNITLMKDFIRAVTYQRDYGIVALNKSYNKTETNFSKFIKKLFSFV